ncbi:MAG: protein-glutamate O-methyltransferase CheR [Thermodesulfovibrionales bacterium]|nr:protein-glutamate O-methyltransferase CheR [Thermodesulfovibrionales bacterium]
MENQVLNLRSSDFGLTDEVFALFSELIYRSSGIRLTKQKKNLLISRLLKRIRALGVDGFYNYYRLVRSDQSELIHMLNCIATNTTRFFREEYHFKFLEEIGIPEFINRRNINIWSAGCSTGEEPYSIAISVSEALSKYRGLKPEVMILGTDISTSAIDFAKRGIYEEDQMPDNTPDRILKKYFLKGVGEYSGRIMVKEHLRNMVHFERLNLKDRIYPLRRDFHFIFCRNVMIYFSSEMKEHVISQFYNHLVDGGYLFLGHSEAILNRKGFIPVYISVYRKVRS